MPFAAAISHHPVAADAVGEVLGRIVERGALAPDLAVVFVRGAHTEFLGEIAHAIGVVLGPSTILGASADAVHAGGETAVEGAALSVFAAWTEPVRPLRLHASAVEEVSDDHIRVGVTFDGLPADIEFGSAIITLADGVSFPADVFAAHVSSHYPGVTVVGSTIPVVDRATPPSLGRAALLLDDTVFADGAVAVVIPPRQIAAATVSQGGRPVGDPMVVTKADRHFIVELAGRPALDQLHLTLDALAPDDRLLANRGLLLGTVTDEIRDDFGRGDFLVRPLLGADRRAGVLAVREPIEVGRTVQFHLQDADSASDELQRLLDDLAGDAALIFAGALGDDDDEFGPTRPSIAERLGTHAVAGMAGDGEIGPVGGRSFLHGYSSSLLVFRDC